jgi:hypothetical protein
MCTRREPVLTRAQLLRVVGALSDVYFEARGIDFAVSLRGSVGDFSVAISWEESSGQVRVRVCDSFFKEISPGRWETLGVAPASEYPLEEAQEFYMKRFWCHVEKIEKL